MNCNLDIQKTNYPFLLIVIIQDILIFCALESDYFECNRHKFDINLHKKVCAGVLKTLINWISGFSHCYLPTFTCS